MKMNLYKYNIIKKLARNNHLFMSLNPRIWELVPNSIQVIDNLNGIKQLNGDLIVLLNPLDMDKIIGVWSDNNNVPYCCFITASNSCWTVFDNTSGDMFGEDFKDFESAIR